MPNQKTYSYLTKVFCQWADEIHAKTGYMPGYLQIVEWWAKRYVQEFCVCAAIKTQDGLIIRGHRHADCYRTLSNRPDYKNHVKLFIIEEGFITSRNRFVDRKFGRLLQDRAGIPSVNKDGYRGGILYSEDLY